MTKSSHAHSPCLRVGITGNMGSGKTTVCRIFESLGIPVYDADERAKWLIVNDVELRKGVEAIFGADAYLPDGAYNRPWIAQIVFAQPEKLAALNALVHPAVELDSRRWHAEMAENGAAYTLREAALLIESGNHQWLDALIVVTAPEELRVQRVIQRDHLNESQVKTRLAAQMPETDKVKLANFVIKNDGQHLLLPQVMTIHQQLMDVGTTKKNIS